MEHLEDIWSMMDATRNTEGHTATRTQELRAAIHQLRAATQSIRAAINVQKVPRPVISSIFGILSMQGTA